MIDGIWQEELYYKARELEKKLGKEVPSDELEQFRQNGYVDGDAVISYMQMAIQRESMS